MNNRLDAIKIWSVALLLILVSGGAYILIQSQQSPLWQTVIVVGTVTIWRYSLEFIGSLRAKALHARVRLMAENFREQ